MGNEGFRRVTSTTAAAGCECAPRTLRPAVGALSREVIYLFSHVTTQWLLSWQPNQH